MQGQWAGKGVWFCPAPGVEEPSRKGPENVGCQSHSGVGPDGPWGKNLQCIYSRCERGSLFTLKFGCLKSGEHVLEEISLN